MKEGFFTFKSGDKVESSGFYKNSDESGEQNIKTKIENKLNTKCNSWRTNNRGVSYTLGNITYSVESSTDTKTELKGTATCSWT